MLPLTKKEGRAMVLAAMEAAERAQPEWYFWANGSSQCIWSDDDYTFRLSFRSFWFVVSVGFEAYYHQAVIDRKRLLREGILIMRHSSVFWNGPAVRLHRLATATRLRHVAAARAIFLLKEGGDAASSDDSDQS